MNKLMLAEFSPQAAPEFTDAASAKLWLENVPLANVSAAQQQLLEQVQEFNSHATSAEIRLATLEALREAVQFVEIEQARRFTNRALPMAEGESAVFSATLALWEQMGLGYLRCLEAAIAGEAGMRKQGGLVCQRVLSYTGLQMFHCHRAYRQVPPRVWRELHEGYARAEELGVAEEPVKDYLNRDVNETSPRVAYLRALLLGMANPNELSQRQLTFVAFLLERWADKADLSKEAPEGEEIAPLIVDLQGDFCPERGGPDAAEPRFLDVKRLAKSLRNRIGLLRKGESPAKLALGEDCVQPSCEHLLVFLYRQWCQARPPRGAERKRVASVAQASHDMAALHYYISGRVFRQPGNAKELTQQQRDQIATFGRVSTRDEDDYSAVHGFVLEDWQLEDESSQGLKMVRRAGDPGKRYSHGQLIGVKPADSKGFMLGQVRWLVQNDAGDLLAGIRLLPGLPAASAVRPTGLNVVNPKYVPALSLTGVAALSAPPSLVLPSGWFKPKRVIEVYVEGHVKVRLTEMIERGSDYERIAYEDGELMAEASTGPAPGAGGGPAPTEIKLHQKSRVMEIAFADGSSFRLSYEFLRAHSPSAEVRGHGPGQEVLQTGKRQVEIRALEPVGSYAVQPVFSDSHATGIFSWEYLYHLGENQERLWAEYLAKLKKAGASRD